MRPTQQFTRSSFAPTTGLKMWPDASAHAVHLARGNTSTGTGAFRNTSSVVSPNNRVLSRCRAGAPNTIMSCCVAAEDVAKYALGHEWLFAGSEVLFHVSWAEDKASAFAHDEVFDARVWLAGWRVRSSAPLGQPLHTVALVTAQDSIGGSAAPWLRASRST